MTFRNQLNRRLIFSALFISLSIVTSFSQTPPLKFSEREKNILSIKDEKRKLDSLKVMDDLFYNTDYSKALYYEGEIVTLGKKLNNSSAVVNAYLDMGMSYLRLGDLARTDSVLKLGEKESLVIDSVALLVKSYRYRGLYFYNSGITDSARVYFRKAIAGGKKKNLQESLASSYSNYANTFENFDSIEFYLKMAIEIYKAAGKELHAALTISNLVDNYLTQGIVNDSTLMYLNESITLAKKANNPRTLAYAYINMEYAYSLLEEYEKSLEASKTAYQTFVSINDAYGIRLSLYLFAYDFLYLGKYDSVKYYLDKSTEFGLKNKIEEPQSTANLNSLYGSYYVEIKNYRKAFPYFENCISFYRSMNDYYHLCDIYRNMGICKWKLNQGGAEALFDSSFFYANLSGSKSSLRDVNFSLAAYYSATGNFKQAFYHRVQFDSLRQVINDDKKSRIINELNTQYQTEKKSKEIEHLESEKKLTALQLSQQEQRIWIISLTGLLLLVSTGGGLWFNRRMQKINYERRLSEQQHVVLRSQLDPHFIFNALNSIRNYISHNPKTGDMYLLRFSELMRGVLESTEKSEITLEEEMELMEHYIVLEQMRVKNGFNYSITYDKEIDRANLMIPPLITQPVIENAIWHGLDAMKSKGELHIHHALSGNKLIISVTNSRDASTEEGKPGKEKNSFGLKITRERLALTGRTAANEKNVIIDFKENKVVVSLLMPVTTVNL